MEHFVNSTAGTARLILDFVQLLDGLAADTGLTKRHFLELLSNLPIDPVYLNY